MRCRRKEEAFLGTACTARWEYGEKRAKISLITDLAPGQPVTEMSFPTRIEHTERNTCIPEVAEKHDVSCYLGTKQGYAESPGHLPMFSCQKYVAACS